MSTHLSRRPAMPAPVFHTLTGEDWGRGLAAARKEPNAVAQKIRAAIAKQKADKPKTTTVGEPRA